VALREEYEQTGSWLFRWRSYVPLIFIVLLVVSLLSYQHPQSDAGDEAWELLCLTISLTGLAIRAFTIGYTPRGTSGRNTKTQIADSLNTTGMYSLVRHPLYLGNFLMWLGVALFPMLWWMALLCTLLFWVYYERIMFAEEAFLRKKYGKVYEEWAKGTPAFMPSLKCSYRKPEVPFSLRNVLKREYNGLLGAVLCLFMAETVGDYFAGQPVHVDLMWKIILAVTITIWLVLRTLKRHTNVLNVDGR